MSSKISSLGEYTVLINGKTEKYIKYRNESSSQFCLRIETYIKALEKGYNIEKALMLSSIACNKIKYRVNYRNFNPLIQ